MTLGLVTAVAMSTAVTTASAQDERSLALADGAYVGSVDFTGGFGAVLVADGGSLNIFLDGRLNGPAAMSVDEGVVSGTWSLTGSSSTNGALSASGGGDTVTFTVEGSGEYTGQGEFEGVADDARMVGTLSGANTVTVSNEFFSETTTDDEPSDVNLQLNDPIGDCGRAFARLDLDLNQSIESIPGFSSEIIGVLGAADPDGSDIYISELEVFAGRVAALWNRVSDPGEFALELVAEALALLREVETLEDSWDFDSCRAKPEFANVMTLMVASLIERILSDIDNGVVDAQEGRILLERGVELGLRTGAFGLPGRGLQLAQRSEAALEVIFDVATTGPEPSQDVARETALLAAQSGWNLTNSVGITSTDYLVTLGVE